MKFWYRVCFVLVRVGLFFWQPVLRVQGLENLTKGAAVLCGNHSSAADPLWIILALASSAGLTGTVIYRRRKKQNR